MWKFATVTAQEVIRALDAASSKEFLIPEPSKRVTVEEQLRL